MKFTLATLALLTATVINARAVIKRDSYTVCQSDTECTVPGETCFEYIQYGQSSNFTSCQDRSGFGNTCNFDSDCQPIEFCNAFGHGNRACVRMATDVPEGTLCESSAGCRSEDVCVAYSDNVSACVREFDATASIGDECFRSKECPYNADCVYNTTAFISQCTRNDGPDSPPVVQGLPYPLPSAGNGTETNGTMPLPTNTTSPVNATSPVASPLPANATEPAATPLPANATSPAVNTATSDGPSSETSTSSPAKESAVVGGGETSHPVAVPGSATEVPVAHTTSTDVKPVEASHPVASAVEAHPADATQAPSSPVNHPTQATQGPGAAPPVVASIVSVMSALGPKPSVHAVPAPEPVHETAPAPIVAPEPIACPSVDLSEVLKQLQEIKSELACFKDILYSINGTITARH